MANDSQELLEANCQRIAAWISCERERERENEKDRENKRENRERIERETCIGNSCKRQRDRQKERDRERDLHRCNRTLMRICPPRARCRSAIKGSSTSQSAAEGSAEGGVYR